MEKKDRLKIYEIRTALYEQNINELMNLIPYISYNLAISFIRDYYDNLEAEIKMIQNGQTPILQEEKEKRQLLLLLEMSKVTNKTK